MNIWEFRKLVRANRSNLGAHCCPLGCSRLEDMHDLPMPSRAAARLGLTWSYASGVASGWDCGDLAPGAILDSDSQFDAEQIRLGMRYGNRLRKVTGISRNHE